MGHGAVGRAEVQGPLARFQCHGGASPEPRSGGLEVVSGQRPCPRSSRRLAGHQRPRGETITIGRGQRDGVGICFQAHPGQNRDLGVVSCGRQDLIDSSREDRTRQNTQGDASALTEGRLEGRSGLLNPTRLRGDPGHLIVDEPRSLRGAGSEEPANRGQRHPDLAQLTQLRGTHQLRLAVEPVPRQRVDLLGTKQAGIVIEPQRARSQPGDFGERADRHQLWVSHKNIVRPQPTRRSTPVPAVNNVSPRNT